MKNFFTTKGLAFVSASLIILLACSCQLEGENIGDLYGRWKLESISNTAGVIAEPDTVFISFQGDCYQYQPHYRYDWGTYEKSDTELTLNPLAYRSSFGFQDLMHNNNYNGLHPISFSIESLSDKDMILKKNDSIWVFRKFIQ